MERKPWEPYVAVQAKMIDNTPYVESRYLAEACQEITRLKAMLPRNEFVDSQEFYERMQTYRHATHDPVKEFENIKDLIRFNYVPRP